MLFRAFFSLGLGTCVYGLIFPFLSSHLYTVSFLMSKAGTVMNVIDVSQVKKGLFAMIAGYITSEL